jgi:putative DNA primase/helicase
LVERGGPNKPVGPRGSKPSKASPKRAGAGDKGKALHEAKKRLKLRVIDGTKGIDPTGGPDVVDDIYDCTDTGNCERLAARHGHVIRYVPSWLEYLHYVEGQWRRDTAGVHLERFAKDTMRLIHKEAEGVSDDARKPILSWEKKSAAAPRLHAMIDLLKSEPNITVNHTALDVDRYTFNVKNGTLDLKTGELRPHNAKDLLTKRVSIEYNKKAKAPRWHKFLKEILPDVAVRNFMHRFMGYCLTGDVSERMFVILLGAGKNGKSAFLNAIESVMEEYATTAAPTLLVARDTEAHPTEVADLFGARLAVSSETKKGATFDEERVKRLTGNDRLKARRMHENFWHFEPTHKLLIASNHKPRVKDATDSFWDRVAIVPFDVRIDDSKVDRDLGIKLRAEREGILAWMVEGCLLWQQEGLKAPAAVREATEEYREEEDIVGRFLDECCAFDKKTITTETSQLMKVHKIWAEGLNLYPVSAKELAVKLRAEGCTATKTTKGYAAWKGVQLTQDVKYNDKRRA